MQPYICFNENLKQNSHAKTSIEGLLYLILNVRMTKGINASVVLVQRTKWNNLTKFKDGLDQTVPKL